ncbi:MAG: MBL fold metallo-hydrolase [Gemmatimonadetes bacterium]|nr:MBL fold metallo-hydrolase [Gemmatimonadota bacterium]
MRIGDVEWHLVSDGTFRLDGGAMFGVVPKPLWERRTSPDERNRITLGTNCLLIRSCGRIVLVDTGNGRKEDAKFREIFGFGEETDLVTSLAAHGVAPADVDTVVYTHLHFDHAGGGTRRDEDGRVVPVFPNARHVVQRAELEDAESPTVRSSASYLPHNWRPIADAGLLDVVDGEIDVAPGVRTMLMKGHVRALTGIVIESGNEKLVYPTDNMPTSAHAPVPWVMGYDLYPLDTVAFKERYLPAAIDENWIVAFEHDPVVGAARIRREGRGLEFEVVAPAPGAAP